MSCCLCASRHTIFRRIVTEDQLHDILNEVDVNKNAQVDIGEFLQVSTLYARHNFYDYFYNLRSKVSGVLLLSSKQVFFGKTKK
jgi:hypothetical protein